MLIYFKKFGIVLEMIGGCVMSTNKEQKFFVGVLSILAAAILGHPTVEAAQVLQTAAEETSSVKSNAVEAIQLGGNSIARHGDSHSS